MLRRILPLCIFCLSVLALASQVEKGAEIDMISHDGESYPRVFVPTEEFQVIKEGQEIPSGLHVRINLQTGEKEAKFNDPSEGDDRSHKIDLKDIQIIDDPESRERKKKLVQTYAAPSGPSPSNDHEIFLDALRSLTDTTASTNSLESSLSNLELLSHDLEYGIKLVHPEILSTLLQFLQTHQDATIRQSSARIIGSSLLNNPESHYLVSGQGLLEKFVAIIEKEEDNGVRASVVFALSAATASEEDMREVMQAGGSEVLRRVYEKGDSDVKGKCATFVEDKLLLHRSIAGVDSEISQWCHIFQRSLLSKIEKKEPLTSQKLLSSLIAMKKEARALCQTEPDFLTWLADRVVSPGGVDDGVRGLIKEARHLFGNPNAARKTAWEDEPKHVKDEL